MSAIITNQFRINNAEEFVRSVKANLNSYYTFIAQPNETNPEVGTGRTDWGSGVTPLDDFKTESSVKETIIALKKIQGIDVTRVIPKYTWANQRIYEMYRHDYSIFNLSPRTSKSNLYECQYYVINKNLRVYICLNNGTDPDNPLGKPSLDEPDFIDLSPRPAGNSEDGYIWKYLFTIAPTEIVKFDTLNYIPVPENWGEVNTESKNISDSAINGKIETVLIKSRGSGYPINQEYRNIPILGDGDGGKVTITTNSSGQVDNILVTTGGSSYTKGTIELSPGSPGVPNTLTTVADKAIFDVIIPPKGGHGKDIHRELGAHRVLVYSRYETTENNPDVFVGNSFATIGIIKNPDILGNTNSNYVSGLGGIKLDSSASGIAVDTVITQSVGVGSTAVGYIGSWDQDTKILKYYQSVGMAKSEYGYKLNQFTSNIDNLDIETDFGTFQIDSSFSGSSITINNRIINLGSSYQNGISLPEYIKGSGEILYVDNRQPIERSANQKEDIKIVLEF